MKKTIIILVMAMLCLIFTQRLPAQTSTIQVLKISDRLRDAFWSQEHQIYSNGEVKTRTLNEFKGKILILDFWATWCGGCLAEFPKLSKIQQKFDSSIQIILVNCENTGDTVEKIKTFHNKRTDLFPGRSLPGVVMDKFLMRSFPHRFIPHYVWIDQSGKILAFSNSTMVNEAVIQQMITQNKSKEQP
ncbi:TlpA family protein disulfide reductase [Pedobacter psychrodurus]|uniref:TlpA family protein disulfide reductase n=1 Tax=Pedobacter psychrodurus TaxID=2530456 RepID=UPI0012283615|nr:TlpA disulfide reductase family protein [Pedobacter psychrodurus]RZJ92629.1 MAG: TlpA family protein disulfide reductase [Chryseobacterium sp.]